MVGVLEMNKSIFGSTFIEKKASRRARKAMAMDLMVPSNAVEVTSEEMEYIDGGWTYAKGWFGWNLGVKYTKDEAQEISTNLNFSAGVAGIVTAISTAVGFVPVALVAGIMCGSFWIYATAFADGAYHKGVTLWFSGFWTVHK